MSEKTRNLPHKIELNLREVGQLFNTMDPAPFPEKDLDADAEEFILSWVREFPLNEPVSLVVHLAEYPANGNPQADVEQGIHHYFTYRMRLNRMELRHLFKDGRKSLIIGLGFLSLCLMASHAIGGNDTGTARAIARESLTIAGWVAMWRPMQIYLYDWWPLRHRGRLYQKLARMHITVQKKT
ncbi:MAG: hypothetical protein P4N60_10955 [Verrucomicrobiae bacterium]|nr:hypothetical protein [Verrucomicrobiae bacterium]